MLRAYGQQWHWWVPQRSRRLRPKYPAICAMRRRGTTGNPLLPHLSGGLGIAPDPSKAGRNYDDGHGKPVMPTVPQGWHYVPSSDGAGVLAPAAQFHPTFPHFLDDRLSPTLVLDAALRHAAEHFPATALAPAGVLLANLAAQYRDLSGNDRRIHCARPPILTKVPSPLICQCNSQRSLN
jgi:hypothetical protein